MKDIQLGEYNFADDIVILLNNKVGVQYNITEWNEVVEITNGNKRRTRNQNKRRSNRNRRSQHIEILRKADR